MPGKGIFARFINLQDLTAIIPSTTAATPPADVQRRPGDEPDLPLAAVGGGA